MKPFIFTIILGAISSLALVEDSYFGQEEYSVPKRTISVIVGPRGYYPKKMVAYVGEEVQFYLTNSDSKQSCFTLPSHNLFLSAENGLISEGKALFDKVGEYKFYCPTGKISGKIVVLEHPEKKRKRMREIASQKDKIKIWFPREE